VLLITCSVLIDMRACVRVLSWERLAAIQNNLTTTRDGGIMN